MRRSLALWNDPHLLQKDHWPCGMILTCYEKILGLMVCHAGKVIFTCYNKIIDLVV